MEKLTGQEQKIWGALLSFQQENGYSPSQRELAKKVGFKSPNTADYYLNKLERKGYIKCPKNRLRAIQLNSTLSPDSVKIPVLGIVPAGVPNLATEQYEEFMDVDRSFIKGMAFGLKVKGDSMKDAGILEGDILIVQIQSTAENGEIVVARFEDEATVKYFKHRKDGIFLVPGNQNYKSISAKDAQIIGKVTGVMRRYEEFEQSHDIAL